VRFYQFAHTEGVCSHLANPGFVGPGFDREPFRVFWAQHKLTLFDDRWVPVWCIVSVSVVNWVTVRTVRCFVTPSAGRILKTYWLPYRPDGRLRYRL